jgi:hypothetical protein
MPLQQRSLTAVVQRTTLAVVVVAMVVLLQIQASAAEEFHFTITVNGNDTLCLENPSYPCRSTRGAYTSMLNHIASKHYDYVIDFGPGDFTGPDNCVLHLNFPHAWYA